MIANKIRPVLVVEDDPDLLEIMEIVLDSESYSVRKAFNGRDALIEARKEMPGLVLLDMQMPVMDGWEFAQRFREEFDSRAPIVVITAATDARWRAEKIGAQGYLAKPFEIDDLISCVFRHYQATQLADS
jgi:DNA-binding response OmpR family regulator